MDEKTQAKIDAAFQKGAKAERSRINKIISDATSEANTLEDRAHKKVVKDALKGVKDRVRDEAGA